MSFTAAAFMSSPSSTSLLLHNETAFDFLQCRKQEPSNDFFFFLHFFLHLFTFLVFFLSIAPLGSSPCRDEFNSWRLCVFSQWFRFILKVVVRTEEKEDVGGGCLVSEEVQKKIWGGKRRKEFVMNKIF